VRFLPEGVERGEGGQFFFSAGGVGEEIAVIRCYWKGKVGAGLWGGALFLFVILKF
jgi:hypothetical protein